MTFINGLSVREKIRVFERIEIEDIVHVNKLRKEDLELLFSSMILPLKLK